MTILAPQIGCGEPGWVTLIYMSDQIVTLNLSDYLHCCNLKPNMAPIAPDFVVSPCDGSEWQELKCAFFFSA